MKEKHLEFIQGVINRMGQNSFLLKGWAVTLLSALFALSAIDSNKKFLIVTYFPVIVFWLLDSYYLYQERLFRKLYDNVRKQQDSDFLLATKEFDNGLSDWASAIFSKTELLFYGPITVLLILLMFFLRSA